MIQTVTLQERIVELIAQHGSMRAAARVLQIDHGYLYRLESGDKTNPGKALLRRMGLEEIKAYKRLSLKR